MLEDKYLKIVIHAPDRDLFSYLQQNILHEDVQMFYIPDLSEIQEFTKKIHPNLLVIYLQTDILLNEKILPFFQNPLLKETGLIFILPDNIPLDRIKNLGEMNKTFVFSEKNSKEVIAQNIRAILGRKKIELEQFSSREYSQNLLKCARIINQENTVPTLFDKLINYLPKILPYDYIALFSYDPELNHIKEFQQFIPPHRRGSAIITPNLEKLAEVWTKQKKSFQVGNSEDQSLFRKLNEWGWLVKQIYFFPIFNQNLILGGLILGQVSQVRKGKTGTTFLNEINDLIGLKLSNFLLMGKGGDPKDDFTEQLVHNRFSEESILQLTCKKINTLSKSVNTIFWQINRGFGFLFPKFSYGTEDTASWKSLEKTMLFLNKDIRLNQLILNDKIVTVENVYNDSKFDTATLDIFKKLGYHNLLIAPMRIQNDQVGVFLVNRSEGKPHFNPWEVSQISLLVEKVKKVLEDTYVVKEANLKLRQLAKIFELGNDIKLELKLNEILSNITKSIRKTLGWNDIAVLQGNDFIKVYSPISKLGFDKDRDLPFSVKEATPFDKIDKFLENCQKISHSYFYDTNPLNIGSSENGFMDDVITEWKENDLLVIPIESRQHRLGFLAVKDPVDRMKPNEDKIISLEYFANQIAVAVENASLYENLQISEERYRTLAETMTLGLASATPEGNIIYINSAFEKLVGFSRKTLLKQPLVKYFSQDSQKKLQSISREVLETKERKKKHIENIELELISTAGEVIPVSTYIFPFTMQRGSRGFFLVLNDLRLIKKIERMRSDFNSMIVHDLRSPLNVIQGFIELIRTRVVGEINIEQEELLDIAKENVKKVLNLVDNFLVASKLEVGKFGIEPKVGEINSLIEKIVDNHRILLKNKKITLDNKLNPNLPLLYFDSLRLEQVMNNLLSNAIKFTPETDTILILTEIYPKEIKGEEKLFARIGVRDRGPGIEADKLSTVFEKYEQIDSELTPKSSGTGLGLAICKEIVNLHGGEIWVESQKNKGSTFYFTLPIEPSIDKILK